MGTTPIYGFPYPDPSDLVANYPALGQTLAEDVETVIDGLPSGALSVVVPTSIANSGGTATATAGEVSFSGVTSVSLNGVFTSAYRNYLILLSATSSTSVDFLIRLRAAGVDTSGSSYQTLAYYVSASANNPWRYSNSSAWQPAASSLNYVTGATFNVFNPQAAVHTQYVFNAFGGDAQLSVVGGGAHLANTSFDGFSLLPNSGNATGTIRVYSYQNG